MLKKFLGIIFIDFTSRSRKIYMRPGNWMDYLLFPYTINKNAYTINEEPFFIKNKFSKICHKYQHKYLWIALYEIPFKFCQDISGL